MDRWTGKVALVTGASVGIGAQIAKKLSENGMKVIAIARRVDKLNELAACIKRECKAEIYPLACDIRKEEDILRVFKWAHDKLGGVDVLVNNAGVLSNEPIIEGSTETYRSIMDVNVIAMAICSRELAHSVKKRKAYGHIININSLAGHYAEMMTVPLNLYPASKYAVTAMTHSLRNEIASAQLNIKTTSISPGAVDTAMLGLAVPSDMLKDMTMMKGEDIADAVVYALNTPPNVMINELMITPHGFPVRA